MNSEKGQYCIKTFYDSTKPKFIIYIRTIYLPGAQVVCGVFVAEFLKALDVCDTVSKVECQQAEKGFGLRAHYRG